MIVCSEYSCLMLNVSHLLPVDVIPAALDQKTVVDDENDFEGSSLLFSHVVLNVSSTNQFCDYQISAKTPPVARHPLDLILFH